MTAFANIANFNGQRPVIDPDDAAMLLIDYQSGLFQTVADMPMTTLRNHTMEQNPPTRLPSSRDRFSKSLLPMNY